MQGLVPARALALAQVVAPACPRWSENRCCRRRRRQATRSPPAPRGLDAWWGSCACVKSGVRCSADPLIISHGLLLFWECIASAVQGRRKGTDPSRVQSVPPEISASEPTRLPISARRRRLVEPGFRTPGRGGCPIGSARAASLRTPDARLMSATQGRRNQALLDSCGEPQPAQRAVGRQAARGDSACN